VPFIVVANKAVARWESQHRDISGSSFGADIHWSQPVVISAGHALGICTCQWSIPASPRFLMLCWYSVYYIKR